MFFYSRCYLQILIASSAALSLGGCFSSSNGTGSTISVVSGTSQSISASGGNGGTSSGSTTSSGTMATSTSSSPAAVTSAGSTQISNLATLQNNGSLTVAGVNISTRSQSANNNLFGADTNNDGTPRKKQINDMAPFPNVSNNIVETSRVPMNSVGTGGYASVGNGATGGLGASGSNVSAGTGGLTDDLGRSQTGGIVRRASIAGDLSSSGNGGTGGILGAAYGGSGIGVMQGPAQRQ